MRGRAVRIERARNLRKRMTDAEWRLWHAVRNRQVAGFKLRRQKPIGRYTADFVCEERRLIIELDGGQHAEDRNIALDHARGAWLESQGYRVIRFWNSEVFGNLDGVLERIRLELLGEWRDE